MKIDWIFCHFRFISRLPNLLKVTPYSFSKSEKYNFQTQKHVDKYFGMGKNPKYHAWNMIHEYCSEI